MNSSTEDFFQIFSGFCPFARAAQSEVSAAASGRSIVVTYNHSTGIHVSPNPAGRACIVDRVLISAFGTSNDGGQTWKRGFTPPSVGATETFGDPSVGVEHGVFYFANLAADAIHGQNSSEQVHRWWKYLGPWRRSWWRRRQLHLRCNRGLPRQMIVTHAIS
ncbi:MAG TPA: hypothetical protein VE957_08775 [Terriglobales bacterium]|nr:hypothetical protein [Terriglobales bacterium]